MKEIQQIEKEYTKDKEWYYTGEVTKKNRPINSLLKTTEIEFKQITPNFLPKEEEDKLKKIFLQKIKNEEYCNLIIKQSKEEISDSLSESDTHSDTLSDTNIEEALQGMEIDIRQMSDYNENIANFPLEKTIKKEIKKNHINGKKHLLKKLKRNKNVTLLK